MRRPSPTQRANPRHRRRVEEAGWEKVIPVLVVLPCIDFLVVFEAAGTATYVGQDEKAAVAIFPGGTVWWLNGLTI